MVQQFVKTSVSIADFIVLMNVLQTESTFAEFLAKAFIKYFNSVSLNKAEQLKLDKITSLSIREKLSSEQCDTVFSILMASSETRNPNLISALIDFTDLLSNSNYLTLNLCKYLVGLTKDAKQAVELKLLWGNTLVSINQFREAFQHYNDAKTFNCKDEDVLGDIEIAFYRAQIRCHAVIYEVCEGGHLEKLKEFLSIPGILPKSELIIAAVRSHSREMLVFIGSVLTSEQILYKGSGGWTAAHYAARFDDVFALSYLHEKNSAIFNILSSKGLIFSGDQNLIHVAAQNNASSAVRFVAKVNPNFLDSYDQGDWTPLSLAYYNRKPSMFSLLLELGANPNSNYKPSTKETLLHRACYDEQVEFVKILKGHPKITLTQNTGGETALDVAIARGAAGWFFNPSKDALTILGIMKQPLKINSAAPMSGPGGMN